MDISTTFKELHVWGAGQEGGGKVDGLSRAFLQCYIDTLEPDDTILDVGCGEGHLLTLLQEQQRPCLGIDLNAENVRVAQERGLPVEHMDVMEALDRYLGKYNVISMLDFVEHIPLELFLAIMERVKKHEGIKLWIQTPNLDSMMGIKFWFHMPSHVTPLHPVVLRGILDRFQVGIEKEWTDYGAVPWKGFRRYLTLKILNGLFGPPLARMFLEGANICLVARVSPTSGSRPSSADADT